jgi:ADP-heptose:LPS heptosyltransferase
MARNVEKGPLLLFPTHYLGNFVLGLPWICEIAAKHPESTVVIDSSFAPLLDMTEAKSARVILYPRQLLSKSNGPVSRTKHYFKFLRQLQSHSHICLLDLEGERFTGVLSLLSGCPVRYGPIQKNANLFYTKSIELNYENHRFNAFGELIKEWQAVSTPLNTLTYREQANASLAISKLLAENRLDKNLALIHTGASAEFKRWPASNFATLSKSLSIKGYSVVWIGAGKADSDSIAEIMGLCPDVNTIDLSNKLSFSELVTLMKNSTVYIGADSGPMHLAASTGIPVLGLFGPSKESIWRPLGSHSKVLRSEQSCHPGCKGKVCLSSEHCLKSLSPEVVLEATLNHAPLNSPH